MLSEDVRGGGDRPRKRKQAFYSLLSTALGTMFQVPAQVVIDELQLPEILSEFGPVLHSLY